MTNRERFINILNFKKVEDRLPLVEWAAWWDKTIERWKKEGLPQGLDIEGTLEYFGFDKLICIVAAGIDKKAPKPLIHGGGLIKDEYSYNELRKYLFTDSIIENIKKHALRLKERHEKGEIIIRLWLDGFFWFPRTIFGIERHLYAFYDQPELMHRINEELTEFNIRAVEELFKIIKPDMVGIAEDMSYNHGPMLSYSLFKEFLLPYYQQLVPYIKSYGVHVLVDSDGDITSMIPWLKEAGIDGVYPLERQAGVDLCKIREQYPDFL
ncbi:MAG TPA: uroporphyrinogen decarboxylase family protein, partial [Clostridiales bacterium]|nr:uroporphyrinogen decarboxylase family protein [Clostridiales bacterium]